MLAPHSNSVSIISVTAVSFGLFYVVVQPARADLVLDVQVGGNSVLGPITDNSANDTNPAAGSIGVNVTALNAALTAQGIPVQVDSFSATSNQLNSPNTNTLGFLTQSGKAHFTSTTGAPATVSMIATDHDFLHPNLPVKSLASSASSTFTNVVAGNQNTFQSFFNPNNTHFAQQLASPASVLLPNLANNPSSANNTAATTSLGDQAIPFSLTSRSDLVLGPNTSVSLPASIQFTGTTSVTAVDVIPLPSSLGMTTCALGLAGIASYAGHRRQVTRS